MGIDDGKFCVWSREFYIFCDGEWGVILSFWKGREMIKIGF